MTVVTNSRSIKDLPGMAPVEVRWPQIGGDMTGGSLAATLQLFGVVVVIGLLPVAMNLIGRAFSESWDDWLDERLGRGSIKDCWPYDRLGRPWR